MSKALFNDFNEVSAKKWKQKIQSDLKGADYNDTLITRTLEGIDIKPFYHADDTKTEYATRSDATQWRICQTIEVEDVKTANQFALDSISRGAESIKFVLNTPVNTNLLLKQIDLKNIPICFQTNFISENFVTELSQFASDSKFYLEHDIIGNLAKSGNWFTDLKTDYTTLDYIIKQNSKFKSLLSIDASLYQNAGANSIQQLAYALAHANEYLNHFDKNNVGPYAFQFSVGTNYFIEIAKLKAFRLLWSSLTKVYTEKDIQPIIFTRPTLRNKTIYDYNTNMLRTTTECMSAILGGSDYVSNSPYDYIFHNSNEFGERISRNQLLVLKNESYFDKVSNPTEGAYYIETLTQQLAEKALDLFKSIEDNGGFLHQLKEGTIQRKIKASAAKEQERFDNGKDILLGTNKHPNTKDQMRHNLEKLPFLKQNKRKTLIEPIIQRRLAEGLEQERLNAEN
ncbi:MAG: methylmalonyl-CoA mutase [Flavobacteriaceae bacterium]|nr:methylmalonyl-CoA mutase [Flavobacteriaceae bacterium]